jgi:hypothetical protein
MLNQVGLGGHRGVQGVQPQGQLANLNLQMNQGGNPRHGVNFGHQPPVWLAPPPQQNNLGALQQVQGPPQNAPQLPPLPQVPPTQIGGYHLANSPALQNAQRAPVPTFAPSQQTQAALDNLRNARDLLNNVDDIVQATQTKGSKRFQPVADLLTQNKNVSADQAPGRQMVQAAQDYINERGSTTSGPPWNRQTVTVPRPQVNSLAHLKQELANPQHDSTTKKLMVADFIVREFTSFAQSTANVGQTIATAQQQGVDAARLADLAAIAKNHPNAATGRLVANELLQGLANVGQQQVNQLVQQAGLGAVEGALFALENQAPPSQARDQVVTKLATAIASDPQLARAYVQNGLSRQALDCIFNGQNHAGYLTPLNTVKDMVGQQFKFELPNQNDNTLLRGNTPASRMLTSGLERAGQGYLSNISNQIVAIIQQEVQQAQQQGTQAVVQSQGYPVGNPTVVGAILQRVMPLLNPQTTPAELQNFTRFVAGSINQAANLQTSGNDFVKNAVMLRTINSSVTTSLATGSADERTMAATVTAVIQRSLGAGQAAAGFPPHDKYALLNNEVVNLAQPNSPLNQWLNSMT